MFDNRPIGIFDSGVGGISVLRECIKLLPNENFIYFGDIINAPYGDKTVGELINLGINNVKFLLNHNCKAIVIACNTISSTAYSTLLKKFDVPIVEVIVPAVEEAEKISVNKKVVVFATNATISSHIYEKKLKEYNFQNIIEIACPSFVPLIEEEAEKFKIIKAIKNDVKDIKDSDTIILGCTHYPFILDEIREVFPHLNIINPAKRTAFNLEKLLNSNDMLSNRREYIRMYSSKNTILFEKLAKKYKYELI